MDAVATPGAPDEKDTAPSLDVTWMWLVEHWQLVIADLSLHHHVDLYDEAVRARPWPGVRTMIFSLLDSDTRLRRAYLSERG